MSNRNSSQQPAANRRIDKAAHTPSVDKCEKCSDQRRIFKPGLLTLSVVPAHRYSLAVDILKRFEYLIKTFTMYLSV